MPRKPKPPPDDPEQSKRFIEAARRAEVDEDPEVFDRAFQKVAKPKREGAEKITRGSSPPGET
jgi:hypothetical protein